MTPVILQMRNAPPIFKNVEITEHDTPDQFDEQVLEQCDPTMRDNVVKIHCFCASCQTRLAIELNIVFSEMQSRLFNLFPIDAVEMAMTQLDKEDAEESPLAIGWPYLGELVKAAMASTPFLIEAKKKSEEFIEKQNHAHD